MEGLCSGVFVPGVETDVAVSFEVGGFFFANRFLAHLLNIRGVCESGYMFLVLARRITRLRVDI